MNRIRVDAGVARDIVGGATACAAAIRNGFRTPHRIAQHADDRQPAAWLTDPLLAEGAHVIAAARRPTEALPGMASVTPVAVDLTDPAGAEQLLAAAERLDVLVNNVRG